MRAPRGASGERWQKVKDYGLVVSMDGSSRGWENKGLSQRERLALWKGKASAAKGKAPAARRIRADAMKGPSKRQALAEATNSSAAPTTGSGTRKTIASVQKSIKLAQKNLERTKKCAPTLPSTLPRQQAPKQDPTKTEDSNIDDFWAHQVTAIEYLRGKLHEAAQLRQVSISCGRT